MKIILLENVRKVGSIGEIIDVKRGYARNFLISQKKALLDLGASWLGDLQNQDDITIVVVKKTIALD